MVKRVDGANYTGPLKPGQVWVKGNREKTIVGFDNYFMYYQTKTDIKKGSVTGVRRSVFRDWLHSGAQLKIDSE